MKEREDRTADDYMLLRMKGELTKEDSLVRVLSNHKDSVDCVLVFSDSKPFFPKLAKISSELKIIGVTSNKSLAEQMNVLKGITPVYQEELSTNQETIKELACKQNFDGTRL